MKTLNETLQMKLNESFINMLQYHTDFLSKNGKSDTNGMINLTKEVPIGENSAAIKAINTAGDVIQLDIDGSMDAINIRFFSDEVIKEVIKALDIMIKKTR